MDSVVGGMLIDAVLGNLPGLAAGAIPEHLRKRALARWDDVRPFSAIPTNHDLIRAARLAWIEAAFAVFDAAEAASGSEKRANADCNIGQVTALGRENLRKIRAAAFDRRITPEPSAIDAHLATILEGIPELIVRGSPTADPITSDFPATLAQLTGWPEAELPGVLGQIATRGLPTPGGGPARSFGELVLAAFAELIKDPSRYPQAGAAFRIAIQKMVLDLQRAMLPLLEGLPEAVEALIAARHRLPIDSGRADLAAASERVRLRPAELLIARYQATRFLDRGGLLAELLYWAAEPGPRRAMGRLCPAPGGRGKTRLGIELIETLQAGGWRGTFLSHSNMEGMSIAELRDLFRSQEAAGICVVLDYAEGQIDRLRATAMAAAREVERGPPIRILALARSAAGWWDSFSRESSVAAVFAPQTVEWIANELSVDDRRALYEMARQDFRDHLKRLQIDGADEDPTVPDLQTNDYASPLGVLAAAFLSARGQFDSGEPVFETLYQQERQHWRRAVGAEADDDGPVDELGRVATQVTLVQGASEEGVIALVQADNAPHTRSTSLLVRDMRRLYGRTITDPHGAIHQRSFVGPIEPDILGEHAAMSMLAKDRHTLLFTTMRAALDGMPLRPDDPRRIFTVLERSARSEQIARVRNNTKDAVEALKLAVSDLTLPQASKAAVALQPYSLTLLDLSATVARHVADLSPLGDNDDERAARAMACGNLGINLMRVGRPEAALPASEEATALFSHLAVERPKPFLPEFARSLTNLAAVFKELRRWEDALTASRDAVDLYRQLDANYAQIFLPDLAKSLMNLAVALGNLKLRDEALAISKEAVAKYSALTRECLDVFLPDLATSLNNHSNRLSELGYKSEALEASQKGTQIWCDLAAAYPGAYLPALAHSLNNTGSKHAALGQSEALAQSEEAVDVCRRLVSIHPRVGLAELARSLNYVAAYLAAEKKFDKALAPSVEAVASYRTLAESQPDIFLPDVARATGLLSDILARLGRLADAASAARDGLIEIAPFVEREPHEFGQLGTKLRHVLIKFSEAAGIEPDRDLLDRVSQALGAIDG